MSFWIILLVTGFFAGIFSGMFGIGGGVVIVPVLLVFFAEQFTTQSAVATSLSALLLPVGLFAVISYHRAKLMDVGGAARIALGLLLTTLVGAEIALNLDAVTLKQVYGIFLMYMGWRFAEPRKFMAERRGTALSKGKPEPADPASVPWTATFGIGLMAGVFSGMFGIGGGAVIVPALVGFFRYDQKLAVGTSLGALLLPVGLPGVLRYYASGVLDPLLALPIALGLAGGALLGARIALGLPSQTVKRLYGVFLLAIGTWFIIQPLVLPS